MDFQTSFFKRQIHANHKFIYEPFEEPKTYDYIPETYKFNWDQPEKFIPDYMLTAFNRNIFLNVLQRECFRSCVGSTSTAMVSRAEETCFNNCLKKHSASVKVFSDLLLQTRKWKGFLAFLNLNEYAKKPCEMGKISPTDPVLRQKILQQKEIENNIEAANGIINVFGKPELKKNPTIFDLYLKGKYVEGSAEDKERLARVPENMYEDFVSLKEKYGKALNDSLEGKGDLSDYGVAYGENFQPDDE